MHPVLETSKPQFCTFTIKTDFKAKVSNSIHFYIRFQQLTKGRKKKDKINSSRKKSYQGQQVWVQYIKKLVILCQFSRTTTYTATTGTFDISSTSQSWKFPAFEIAVTNLQQTPALCFTHGQSAAVIKIGTMLQRVKCCINNGGTSISFLTLPLTYNSNKVSQPFLHYL